MTPWLRTIKERSKTNSLLKKSKNLCTMEVAVLGLWYSTKRNETIGNQRNETKQLVFDETKQPLTLEKSGNCSSAAPNTLDTIAILFRYMRTPEAQ